jgi:hypothetical protein
MSRLLAALLLMLPTAAFAEAWDESDEPGYDAEDEELFDAEEDGSEPRMDDDDSAGSDIGDLPVAPEDRRLAGGCDEGCSTAGGGSVLLGLLPLLPLLRRRR